LIGRTALLKLETCQLPDGRSTVMSSSVNNLGITVISPKVAMSDKLIQLFATFFYIGHFPAASGTLASVAGVFISIGLCHNPVGYIFFLLMITLIGFTVSGPMEKLIRQKDPSCIVIDEVAGVMLAFFLLPLNMPVLVTAFFLFRAFDMFKIYPVNKFEALGGSSGVMMDDLIAGIYTNITMHAAIWFSGFV